jgi:hypothetical protein
MKRGDEGQAGKDVRDRRMKIRVTLSAKETTRFGWTGGTQQVLCPYCRDGIDPKQDGLEACEVCHTVHHAVCLDEANGCTIFGCDAQGRRHWGRQTA